MENIWTKLDEISKTQKSAALCIITETSGSTPRKIGTKMIVMEDGATIGTIGGGHSEKRIVDEALKIMKSSKPAKRRFDLEDEVTMQQSGSIEVYIEPIVQSFKLIIFGAGHVGSALGKYARKFGFMVSFVEDRTGLAEKMLQNGFEVISGGFITQAESLECDDKTFFVVVTPKHSDDYEVTAILVKKKFAYLGMIGSKRKVADAKQYFLENKNLTEAEIAKIDMPIGISFNAQTPEEIAISILAKLIDVKNSM